MMSATESNDLHYHRNGERLALEPATPREMLLDRIRLLDRRTGTKEGCNEGDCGACTVVLKRVIDGRARYLPINSCILLSGQIDGAELITIEDLSRDGVLHPVQAAMVKHHGSQCGFCTPGIVMSLYALYENTDGPVTREAVLEALQGNLCRCTGYRPIIDAAMEACAERVRENPSPVRERGRGEGLEAVDVLQFSALISAKQASGPHPRPFSHPGEARSEAFFTAPQTEDAFAALLIEHPDALIVSGATDVGLWITKRLDDPKKIAWTGRIAGFGRIEPQGDALFIGAGASHAGAWPHLAAIDPDLGEVMRRFGSAQVRAFRHGRRQHRANGSPIGDLAPCFIALGATLHLRLGDRRRDVPLENFFIAYGKQDRQAGEFVTGVTVPKLMEGEVFRAFKLSKRVDEDISAVMLAIKASVVAGVIASCRIAFGGMAGTPKRAETTETALTGLRLEDRAALETAIAALQHDFSPLSDMRASAAYRLEAAKGMLLRALLEIAGGSGDTRLVGARS